VLLFDVAGPGRAGPTRRRESSSATDNWTIRALAEEDSAGTTLARHVTLITPEGVHHDETHVLRLYRPGDVEAALGTAGFHDIRRLSHYQDYQLYPGLTGFLARR
jgi:hypothetical protein